MLSYFDDPQNWEVMVKIRNFCHDTARNYRALAAGSTDNEVPIRTEDPVTGRVSNIDNPFVGHPFNFTETEVANNCP